MCRVIGVVFPDCSHVSTAQSEDAADDTLFLPVLFKSLAGWVHVESDFSVFFLSDDVRHPRMGIIPMETDYAHVLCALSLEVLATVADTSTGRTKGVMVISFLSHLLDGLEWFLYEQLQSSCVLFHEKTSTALPPGSLDAYSYTKLKESGLIVLQSIVPAGGFDRDVAMLLAPHRRDGDFGPQGLMTDSINVVIGLSRAIKKCYVFAC